jgi:hypothetical protein
MQHYILQNPVVGGEIANCNVSFEEHVPINDC